MEWKTSAAPMDYNEAVAFMEARVQAIREGMAEELIWLLEHPPLYTAGTGAKGSDLLDTLGFPVFSSGRGGQYTYHGPGQRVAYVLLDLKKRTPDVRRFVRQLEHWIIAALTEFGVHGFIRDGRVGVWVETASPCFSGITESKIAAIGVRVRKWVTYHGLSINVHPDLSHYRGIIPCGIKEYGVTSLAALGVRATLPEVDAALKKHFEASLSLNP